jgi:hypothetical protein
MISTRIRKAIRQQWAGLLALFLVLTGGSAYALDGSNTVFTDDIVNEVVRSVDIGPEAVTAGDIAPGAVGTLRIADESVRSMDVLNGNLSGIDLASDSVKGVDVDEPTLGEVPSARIGGIGEWNSPSTECDVEVTSFVTCVFTTINLPPAPSTGEIHNVLLIGVVKAQADGDAASGTGECLLATHFANIPESTSGFTVGGSDEEHVPLVANTVAGQGPVDFAVRCREVSGGVRYFDAAVAAVVLAE